MVRRLLALGVAVLCCPAAASAQDVTVARFLSNALTSAARIARPLGGSSTGSLGDDHGHFYSQAIRQAAPAEFDASLSTQLTTFPTAFAWGASEPAPGPSTEFRLRGSGSSWVESPATLGRGRFTLTFGHEAVEYGRIDGANVRGTSLALWTPHDDCCAPLGSALNPVFERDLLEQRFVVDVDRHVYAVFGALGLSKRLDVGVMVPIGLTRLVGRVTSRIVRTATTDTYVYGFQSGTGTALAVPHGFDAIEIANQTTYYTGEARGIGDVLVKAKLRVAGAADGIALSVGAYLPTGDPEKLLGAGTFRADATLLMSTSMGRFSPHLNVGYTLATGHGADSLTSPIATGGAVASGSALPDVVHAVAGIDWAIHRRVQVAVDIMGRQLSGLSRFTTEPVTFPTRGAGTNPPSYIASDNLTIDSTGSSVVQAMGVAGTRIFVASRLLVALDVLFPINKQGLQTRVGSTFSLSWGF